MAQFERLTRDPVTLAEALDAGKKTPLDAIDLLMQDHSEVLFDLACYAEAEPAEREQLLRKVKVALTAHMAMEEELFYPAAEEATGETDLIAQAMEEHAEAREVLEEIEAASSEDERERLVATLFEALGEHIEAEEAVLFAQLRETDFDAVAMGRDIVALRAASVAEQTGKPEPVASSR